MWNETFAWKISRCDWPSGQFWKDANALLWKTRGSSFDVTFVLKALKTLERTSPTIETFVRAEWTSAWRVIRGFIARHRPKNPRIVSTIVVSYLCGIFCAMFDVESMSERLRTCLVGMCLGMVYTDDVLDDDDVPPAEKAKYSEYLQARLRDSRRQPYDAATRAATEAFEMIEANDPDGCVRRSIADIMTTHHESALRRGASDGLSIDYYRTLVLKLGAQTGRVFAAVLGVPPDDPRWKVIELVGAWMQLLDDAADLHDDKAAGIVTYATATLRCDGTLDAYWHELFVLSEDAALAVHERLSISMGRTAADAARFLMLIVAGMSFAKMSAHLSSEVRGMFESVDDMRAFYASWRAAYEVSVQSTSRLVCKDASFVGRLAMVLAQLGL